MTRNEDVIPSDTSSLISWTPAEGDVGDHSVTVHVEDGNGGMDDQSYTLTISSAGTGEGQTPWQTNENGTLVLDLNWDWTLGYLFTPQVSGQITKLGGYFNGTKTVYLFEKSTGTILAEAQVTSSNNWSYTDISPVSVQAGTEYIVAAYFAGGGASYRNGINIFPQTYGDITINATVYKPGTGMPTSALTTKIFGQVDISFVPY